MELFLKITAGVLLSVVLILTVGKWEKDIAAVLGIAICSITAVAAMTVLQPVVDFLYELEISADLQGYNLGTLMKMVGVGLIAELVTTICQDAGNSSLGKQVQLLASIVILKLSLPMLQTLMDLIENLLGDL